ncbi:MAG: hypothetical protein ACRBB6_04385 [Neptuniibacter sp.]
MIGGNPDNEYAPIWLNGQRKTSLYDMDTQHIQNAIEMYANDRYGHNSWHYLNKDFWIKEFTEELQAREGELTRHPETRQFMSRQEMMEQRKLKRLILGLPPMRPEKPAPSPKKGSLTDMNPDFQSLFTDYGK